jgi:hypothetical protein
MPFPFQHASGRVQVALLAVVIVSLSQLIRSETPLDEAASPPDQPEVWLCAGDRIVELRRPEGEWPFVGKRLTGIKLYVDQSSSGTTSSRSTA